MSDDLIPERRTEVAEYEGMVLAANTCKTCRKWLPPYYAKVPKIFSDDYCWGHELEPNVAAVKIGDRISKAIAVIEGAPQPTLPRERWKTEGILEGLKMALDYSNVGSL